MSSMKNEEKSSDSVSLAYNNVRREIYVTGEVTNELCQNLISAIRELDRTKGKITIILNTGGGMLNAALAMYDFIRLCNNKVTCYCTGNCMSAGMIILCACDERYSTQNCRFMVHSAAISGIGGNLNFLKTLVDEVSDSNETAIEILSKHSLLTIKEVKSLCKETTYMSAEQVMGYGFIDAILTSRRTK